MAEAVCIRAVSQVRAVKVMVEQPQSSAMFSLPCWEELGQELQFQTISTYMGCFAHFMEKPTVLIGNLDTLSWLGRSLSKKQKETMRRSVAKRLEQLEHKLGRKLNLIKKFLVHSSESFIDPLFIFLFALGLAIYFHHLSSSVMILHVSFPGDVDISILKSQASLYPIKRFISFYAEFNDPSIG